MQLNAEAGEVSRDGSRILEFLDTVGRAASCKCAVGGGGGDTERADDAVAAAESFVPLIGSYQDVGDALLGPVKGLLRLQKMGGAMLQYRKNLHSKFRVVLRATARRLVKEADDVLAGVPVAADEASGRADGAFSNGGVGDGPVLDADIEQSIANQNDVLTQASMMVGLLASVLPLLFRSMSVHRLMSKCVADHELGMVDGTSSRRRRSAGAGHEQNASDAECVKDSSDIIGSLMGLVNECVAQIVSIPTRVSGGPTDAGGRSSVDGNNGLKGAVGGSGSERGRTRLAVRVDDAVTLSAVANKFHAISGAFGARSHAIKASVLQLSKFCFDQLHRDNLEKLHMLLKQESWARVVDVPDALSDMINELVQMVDFIEDGGGEEEEEEIIGPERNGSSSTEPAAVSDLFIRGYKKTFRMTSSSPMLVKMVVSYVSISESFPLLATDAVTRLSELLSAYNTETCKLILGAEAIQHTPLNGIRAITAKHIAMVVESLRLMTEIVVPALKSIMSKMLEGPRAALFLPSLDKVVRDMKVHRVECIKKLITIMMERLTFHSRALAKSLEAFESKEHARPPTSQQTASESDEGNSDASPFALALVKELSTLRRILSPLLTTSDLCELFAYVVSNYDTNIAKLFNFNATLVPQAAVARVLRPDAAFLIKELRAMKGEGAGAAERDAESATPLLDAFLSGRASGGGGLAAAAAASSRASSERASESVSANTEPAG